MSRSRFPDKLCFTALWQFENLPNLGEAINIVLDFLNELEKNTLWKRPIDVSGATPELDRLKIKEDNSDFYDKVFSSIVRPDCYYINDDGESFTEATAESRCIYPFSFAFSNSYQYEKSKDSIYVGLTIPTIEQDTTCPPFAGVTISVPEYCSLNANSEWSKPENVYIVFDFLIDYLGSEVCYVYNKRPAYRVLDRLKERYFLGWLTYTRNKRAAQLLNGMEGIRKYKNGTLIELGRDVSVLMDKQSESMATAIRDKLRANNICDFVKR